MFCYGGNMPNKYSVLSKKTERHEDLHKLVFKQWYDLLKHVTTIDTGAVVILATFFNKNFDTTSHNYLLYLFFFSIMVSLFFCVFGMLATIDNLVLIGTPKNRSRTIQVNIMGFVTGVAMLSFFMAILSLVLFVLNNVKM
jgi:hypothetical protein